MVKFLKRIFRIESPKAEEYPAQEPQESNKKIRAEIINILTAALTPEYADPDTPWGKCQKQIYDTFFPKGHENGFAPSATSATISHYYIGFRLCAKGSLTSDVITFDCTITTSSEIMTVKLSSFRKS